MRTAITLHRKHDGTWSLVHGPDVPISRQAAEFRAGLGIAHHPEIAEVFYQESDGLARRQLRRSPKDHEAHEKRRAAEREAARQAGEAANQPTQTEPPPAEPKPLPEAKNRTGAKKSK